MPTYGYECAKCGHQFEVFQSISAAPITKCEECGGKVKQMVFPPGITFKGAGFHINDYAGGGNGSNAKTEPAPPPDSSKTEAPPKGDAASSA